MSNVTTKGKVLTKEEVEHIADLIKLELSDEEISDLQVRLGETIDYVNNLSELDTAGVKESATSGNLKNVSFEDGEESTRTLSQDDAVKNAKASKDGYILVSKILDK